MFRAAGSIAVLAAIRSGTSRSRAYSVSCLGFITGSSLQAGALQLSVVTMPAAWEVAMPHLTPILYQLRIERIETENPSSWLRGWLPSAITNRTVARAGSSELCDPSAASMALLIKGHAMDEAERTTILVVEDEALIRMVNADILEEAGFCVLEAANAAEAILIMEGDDHVELMFTDIRMPGRMDGLELAAFVHAHWPDVRLLVTSGHIVLADSEIPDGGRFVSKPYDLGQLVSKIRASVAAPPPSN